MVRVESEREARDGGRRRAPVEGQRPLQRLDERDPEQPRAGRDGDAHLERRPLAEVEAPDPLAVEPDLQRVPGPRPAPQGDPDDVLGVEGEVVAHREPAPRPERQVLARTPVLGEQRRCPVESGGGAQRRVPDSLPADLRGGQQVALEQPRRDGEDVADVVEAVPRLVGRQQGLGVDLEGQQVADGVGVLGPVQPLHRGAAGVGSRPGRAVEGGLQVVDERGVGRGVGGAAVGTAASSRCAASAAPSPRPRHPPRRARGRHRRGRGRR